MYTNNGYNAYTAVSLDSQIAGATPHQLIVLLYDGAINAMRRAEIYFQSGNIARRGEMISARLTLSTTACVPGWTTKRAGRLPPSWRACTNIFRARCWRRISTNPVKICRI